MSEYEGKTKGKIGKQGKMNVRGYVVVESRGGNMCKNYGWI